ncbi:lipolysis-stimulated lipoprotein receptor isoform X2 [Clupea harengus]|uniref:Lipolysis-stimulated lipoprotein receptor isoform X2 n=1 Tax=Clupea harengus TaxID=7950 RepID=A0A6P3VXV8_CLUHA|nr:lipolysis-stimulated lipoprotein receptor isoform X2 [Clupea harengus]
MYCKIRPTAFLIFSVFFNSYTIAINVQCPVKRHVVMLFQPVTLQCQYQTSDTNPPLITWKYKSFCRDPIEMALSPSSSDNALAQSNPNYDPVTECPDNQRTVRIVASKRISVTLAAEYQGRKISIINNADLNIAQTAWGDSGVYLCTVASDQDLTGNGECYTELIVLDKLLVALVVIGFLLLLLLIGICWCQCCPHSCCCYVSCPCCPERCCCPRALYEAGKAIKSGVPSHYAPTLYAPSMYAQPIHGLGGASPAIPMLPMPPMHPATNYRDYDHASSVGQGSQVPLLQDNDGGGQTRSGYRIQANPDGNPTRVLYYMERELTNLEPGHPGDAAGKYNRLDGMSEVTSLHEMSEPRSHGHSRPPQLPTLYDDPDDRMSTISSVSQHQRPRRHNDSPMNHGARGRARSMDNLDVIYQHSNDDDYPQNYKSGARGGRRGSDDGWNRDTRDDYDHETDRHYHRRNHSPDSHGQNRGRGAGFQQRRSRSRDDLMAMDRNDRGNEYDDRLLREALAKKKLGSQDRLDHSGEKRPMNGHYGPPPLPVSPPSGYPEHFPSSLPYDQESTASSKKSNLRKNGAVSRESLVV